MKNINKKGQMAGVFTSILIVIAFGLVLYMFQTPIETLRLNAIASSWATNPLIRIILYGLQQILWGAWFILGLLFVSTTAVHGGG